MVGGISIVSRPLAPTPLSTAMPTIPALPTMVIILGLAIIDGRAIAIGNQPTTASRVATILILLAILSKVKRVALGNMSLTGNSPGKTKLLHPPNSTPIGSATLGNAPLTTTTKISTSTAVGKRLLDKKKVWQTYVNKKVIARR